MLKDIANGLGYLVWQKTGQVVETEAIGKSMYAD